MTAFTAFWEVKIRDLLFVSAEKAFGIETNLLERRIKNAEKAVRIESARLKDILDPEAEALDNLAQKEIELATIRG